MAQDCLILWDIELGGDWGVKTVIVQDTGTRRIYLRHLYRPPLYCSSEDMITAIQGSFLSSRYTSQYTWSVWPTRKMIERRILTLCMNAGSYIVCYHWRRSHSHGDPGLTLSGQDQPSLYHFWRENDILLDLSCQPWSLWSPHLFSACSV